MRLVKLIGRPVVVEPKEEDKDGYRAVQVSSITFQRGVYAWLVPMYRERKTSEIPLNIGGEKLRTVPTAKMQDYIFPSRQYFSARKRVRGARE